MSSKLWITAATIDTKILLCYFNCSNLISVSLQQKALVHRRFSAVVKQLTKGFKMTILQTNPTLKHNPPLIRRPKPSKGPLRWTITSLGTIHIDYGMSLEDLIAKGKFDDVMDEITSTNFPPSGIRTDVLDVEPKLIEFNFKMSIDGALNLFNRLHLRAGEPSELVTTLNNRPKEGNWIIALGTLYKSGVRIERGSRLAVSFWVGATERKRYLGFGRWGKESWLPGAKFLVFDSEK